MADINAIQVNTGNLYIVKIFKNGEWKQLQLTKEEYDTLVENPEVTADKFILVSAPNQELNKDSPAYQMLSDIFAQNAARKLQESSVDVSQPSDANSEEKSTLAGQPSEVSNVDNV